VTASQVKTASVGRRSNPAQTSGKYFIAILGAPPAH
jgi:hypothetical protein